MQVQDDDKEKEEEEEEAEDDDLLLLVSYFRTYQEQRRDVRPSRTRFPPFVPTPHLFLLI